MHLEQAKGQWALVTGASSGIGEEFCQQLAKHGMNIAMAARREEKLRELALQLKKDHAIDTAVLPLNLSEPGAPDEIKKQLNQRDIKIRLLCNNAASGLWGPYEKADPKNFHEMVKLNTLAPVLMCHCFLPDLTSHPTSVIINVSSQAAYQPVPFMAVYAATKAFMHSFSLALYGEWSDRGVYVQTLVPGPTNTEFDEKAGAYESAVKQRGTPQEVVSASLKQLKKQHPLATNAKGLFTQRAFAGLAPVKMVINEVRKMFKPPEAK